MTDARRQGWMFCAELVEVTDAGVVVQITHAIKGCVTLVEVTLPSVQSLVDVGRRLHTVLAMEAGGAKP